MDSSDHSFLFALAVVIGLVGALLTTSREGALIRFAQRALSGGLVIAIALAVLVFWQEARDRFTPQRATYAADGRIELPQAPDGHYYVTAQVNGAPVRFTVDTGASGIVLSSTDARAAGVDTAGLAYIGRANTANGKVRTAPVRLQSFAIGPILDRSVPAYVNEGAMDGSLLGMSYLQHYDIVIKDGVMTLRR